MPSFDITPTVGGAARARHRPCSAAFFDDLYARAPRRDPWRFATDAYEQRRYAALLAALPRARYRAAFEPGCAIGVLSARLAARCDHLLAVDFSAVALAQARRRCRGRDVTFRRGELPHALRDDDGPFDLIVFAEIGYYFDTRRLAALARRLRERLREGGDIVAEHWSGRSPDHRLSAAQTHRVLRRVLGPPGTRHKDPRFLLDVWAAA